MRNSTSTRVIVSRFVTRTLHGRRHLRSATNARNFPTLPMMTYARLRTGRALSSCKLPQSRDRLGDEAHIHDDAALAGGEQVELVRVFDAVVFSSLERGSASAPATCSTDGNRKCLSEIGN